VVHVIFINAKYDKLLERADKLEKGKELIEDAAFSNSINRRLNLGKPE
jgi:hypothetical protein